jgi:hypothetical protein
LIVESKRREDQQKATCKLKGISTRVVKEGNGLQTIENRGGTSRGDAGVTRGFVGVEVEGQ